MTTSHQLGQLFAALMLCTTLSTQAQMDVDQADSLDFESFHTNKEDAVKIWDSQDKPVTKAYTEEQAVTKAPVPAETSLANNKSRHFEIRELYAITGSDRTGYNPNTVVQALFLQMQGLCPNGWKKLDERSIPDGKEFYMYYQLECL